MLRGLFGGCDVSGSTGVKVSAGRCCGAKRLDLREDSKGVNTFS